MKKKNKKVIEIDIVSYGLYTEWDRESSDLPKFIELTQVVEAAIGIEFGMIVEIRKARGRYLDFLIEHPPFYNDGGELEPSFRDTFRVKHNPFQFFLGDTVWEPIEDKKGDWTLSILDGEEVLVSKEFRVV
ncbi:DUF3859 domain-containing protein [Marinoscillum sp. MHG1-6]|uniref:DUF3859 domain-containing protein n=1 Tax=Marinoscillum sp. MHG1-6 TaxID=2959627 RepID=UPI0021586D9F|nr:DUF3859 domain-containing protein [Marinoscillum sp. MHG1-6]